MDPGDFHRMFRGFFGLNRPHPFQPPPEQEEEDPSTLNEGTPPGNNREFFNFSVFSDPLEIHRFFEQQMEQMFREFGGIAGGNGGGGQFHPPLPPPPGDQVPPGRGSTDRDMMLKHDDYAHNRGQDSDFDERNLTADDLSEVLKGSGGNEESSITRWKRGSRDREQLPDSFFGGSFFPAGEGHSFSFSRSSRTVRRPDGSVHTEERCRNPDGSETVRITINGEVQQQGDEGMLLRQRPDDQPVEAEQHSLRGGTWQFSWPETGGGGGGGEGGGSWSRPSHEETAPPADRLYGSLFSKFFGN